MNRRNRYLSAVLLLLVGILLGGVFVMLQQGQIINDQSKVKFTEIKRSSQPIFSDEELEKLDTRFLFKNVADRVIPSVVYISTVVNMRAFHEEQNSHDFWDRIQPRRARTVGSGVIVSENGYIVTNNHVIEGAVNDGISVTLNDKRLYDARVVGTDPSTDIAVIKIDAEGLSAITIGNSDKVDVGEWVLAIGNPFRLRSTVTAGIVSALGRQVQLGRTADEQLRIESFIQTDAAINKGNSGGALVNTSGELVGINTAIATSSGNYQGYGFAIPSNLVRKVMSDLIQYGEVHRALLGVSILGVDFNRARELGLNRVRGVEIMSMLQNGAAAKHNLQKHDVILSVDGEPVDKSNELQQKVAVHSPGDVIELKIWRDNNIIERSVELGRLESSALAVNESSNGSEGDAEQFEHKEERRVAFGSFDIGFKIMALARSERAEAYDLIITGIEPSSEADQQGLREGYVIKEVDGKKVESLEALGRELGGKVGETVLLKVETPEGALGYYQLKK